MSKPSIAQPVRRPPGQLLLAAPAHRAQLGIQIADPAEIATGPPRPDIGEVVPLAADCRDRRAIGADAEAAGIARELRQRRQCACTSVQAADPGIEPGGNQDVRGSVLTHGQFHRADRQTRRHHTRLTAAGGDGEDHVAAAAIRRLAGHVEELAVTAPGQVRPTGRRGAAAARRPRGDVDNPDLRAPVDVVQLGGWPGEDGDAGAIWRGHGFGDVEIPQRIDGRHLTGIDVEQTKPPQRPAFAVDVGVVALLFAFLLFLRFEVDRQDGYRLAIGQGHGGGDARFPIGQRDRLAAGDRNPVELTDAALDAVGQEVERVAAWGPVWGLVGGRTRGETDRRHAAICRGQPDGACRVFLPLPDGSDDERHARPIGADANARGEHAIDNHLGGQIAHDSLLLPVIPQTALPIVGYARRMGRVRLAPISGRIVHAGVESAATSGSGPHVHHLGGCTR